MTADRRRVGGRAVTATRAPGAVDIGEQDMWHCPDCGALRHRATWIGRDGQRRHCATPLIRVTVYIEPTGSHR